MNLARLVAILELVAIVGQPVSAREIQKATGFPKPICYRLMHACSCSRAIAAFAEPAFQEHIVQNSFADCDQQIDLGIASVSDTTQRCSVAEV